MTLAPTPRAGAWLWTGIAGALLAFSLASSASAQIHCASWIDTLLTYPSYPAEIQCVSSPNYDRSSDVETFRWKGHDYMIMNRGNELSIYNVDDPRNPTHTATSDFDFGTRGDSDYDLIDFDVCDDCRYGILSHKVKRTVVFDLGADGTPSFPDGDYAFYDGRDLKIGGYVFAKGGQEYLLSGTGPGNCETGTRLYTVDGLSSLSFLSCVEVGGAEILLEGLHEYDTGAAFYLFTGVRDETAQVFRADGAGAALSLVHVASQAGMFGRRYELSIDSNNDLLASANMDDSEIQIWDIANPESPQRMWTISGQVNNVSLRSPSAGAASTLMVNTAGWPNSTRTFTVDSSGLEEFEASYWTDISLEHNDQPICVFAAGGALSSDGSVLYLSRYAMHQVFELIECLDPVPAVANLVVTPTEVFPGDTIEIRNVSSGQIHRWALWVTEEPGGTVAAGNATPTDTNPWNITFQIPQDLLWATSYEAHVKVESDDLVPTTPKFDTGIVIDRTPQATITVEPSAIVVGEDVTLTATTAGSPAADPYLWTIDPPSGSSFTRIGAQPTVTLDEAGGWDFHLRVSYDHGAETGGLYEATASVLGFRPASVVADFTISPQSPFHNQQITLDGSSSRPAGGELSFAWTVESAGHAHTGCPAEVTCTIPAESLNPDTTYDVTLTVTNNGDDAVSEIIKPLAVGNGDFQPTITYLPADPEIGESVIFTIRDVPVDIDGATWSMGAPGCSGADPTPECVPGLWTDCKAQAYKFAANGTWTVNVSIEIDGAVISATPTSITVADTGYCAGGWDCGNAGYDNGISASATTLGAGSAGDPDSILAVKFALDDFGYEPNRHKIVSFCAANKIDATVQGGPWPNEVFIHPDSGGMPDESIILGHGTVWTGDGSGSSEVVLTTPAPISGDFWLLSRGDLQWIGEDLNVERDSGVNSGHSYSSSTGIAGIQLTSQGNFLLRVTVEPDNDVFANGFESGSSSGWSFDSINIFLDDFESGTMSAWTWASGAIQP